MAAKKRKPRTRALEQYLEEVIDALGIGVNPHLENSVSDAAFDAKEHFMKEWIDDLDEDAMPSVDQIAEVEDAVDQALQQDFMDSITYKRGEALVDAAQYIADQTDAEMQFSYDRDTGLVKVELDNSYMDVWAQAVKGDGFVAWDPSLRLSDVKNVASVINNLDNWANVYGQRRLQRLYDDQWDRWEPGGREDYRSLRRLAEETLKGTP
jgi:hypothetical protein